MGTRTMAGENKASEQQEGPPFMHVGHYGMYPSGLAFAQGPYGGYPHDLSKSAAKRFQNPHSGFPSAGYGGLEAYPGSFPGHPGPATGAPYPYPQPGVSAGGSHGSFGRDYGAGGLPRPTQHHGYRPGGRGPQGFNCPGY